MTAEELWRGVLAEKGAGGRKGRGKRNKRKLKRDLNRGQKLGEGEKPTIFIIVTSGLFAVSLGTNSSLKQLP